MPIVTSLYKKIYHGAHQINRSYLGGDLYYGDTPKWLFGWSYRKSVTLSRSSGAVTNYQMQLFVGESSGASGENVDCGGKGLTTFADLRFTKSDGITLLDYWIEYVTGTTPNKLASVWIEFDSIGTSDTTFYMYYGNASASTLSSGTNTFITFDDFERGSNGDAVGGSWTAGAAATISTAHDFGDLSSFGTRAMKIAGGSTSNESEIRTTLPSDMTFAVQARVYKETASQHIQLCVRKSNKLAILIGDVSENLLWFNSSGSFVDSGYNMNADSWASIFEIRDLNFTAGTWKAYYNGTLIASPTSMYGYASSECVHVHGDSVSDRDSWIDNVIIRQYLSTEPSWGSWGTEEAL